MDSETALSSTGPTHRMDCLLGISRKLITSLDLEELLYPLNADASKLIWRETAWLLGLEKGEMPGIPEVVNKICAAHYTEYLLLEGHAEQFYLHLACYPEPGCSLQPPLCPLNTWNRPL